LLTELKGYSPRLQVSFDTYDIPQQGERVTRDVELRNVMAVLPGRSPRRLYVSGHYDTVARPVRPGGPASASGGFDWAVGDNPAPGVNDDGSGTALTLELARVFAQSGVEFDATLVFIALAGEEQGLVGAKLHAQRAEAEKWPIEAVLNNDIVGGERGGNGRIDSASVRVFSEGPEDSPSRQLARHIRRQAARYVPSHAVRLIARADRFGRGGDHTAFNQHGFTAVRFTESKENFARQHTVDDTFEGVSPPYLARNTRVNAAALAVLALAPPAPSVADERGRPMLDRGATGYDARLRWKAAPGAAGYRVFWRGAWAPDWEHERTVDNVTELVLPDVSIDDYVFGVAALSAEGQESLVAAYVVPTRPETTIQTKPAAK
jgi:peptidase M28-like protein